jgi:hypothetical protein
MKMIKNLFFILIFLSLSNFLFAQEREPGEPNPNYIGTDSAQQKLKEISVAKFEDPAFFYTAMSRDQGFVITRRLPGNPLDKKPIEDEQTLGINEEDKYVIGLKVHYDRRGVNAFAVMPVKPLPIPGITKTISVWVAGRNNEHVLNIMLLDFYNNPQELVVGKLNFSGWKKLTVAIPPEIKQKDFHYANVNGLKFGGFRVDCDPVDTYGVYYIYFDDLRAVTDLFAEESRDIDDMMDGW